MLGDFPGALNSFWAANELAGSEPGPKSPTVNTSELFKLPAVVGCHSRDTSKRSPVARATRVHARRAQPQQAIGLTSRHVADIATVSRVQNGVGAEELPRQRDEVLHVLSIGWHGAHVTVAAELILALSCTSTQ